MLNRNIARLSKRELLEHAVVTVLKYGFGVYPANPAYTSEIGEKLGRELGLDEHTASAYTPSTKSDAKASSHLQGYTGLQSSPSTQTGE